MKIFISQSGARSKELALEMEKFVRQVVPNAKPWVSDSGIDKGTRSLTAIAGNLEASDAGVICLTSDNLDAPWILFEAGALSRNAGDRVWTLLLDVEHEQVKPPLGQFQHTTATKEDVYKFIESMNAWSDQPRIGDDLKMLFDALWPKSLGPAIVRLREAKAPVRPPKRSTDDLLSEILNTVRDLDRRSSTLAEQQHVVMQAVGSVLESTRWVDRPMSDLGLPDRELERHRAAERWAAVRRDIAEKRAAAAAAKKVADTAASIVRRSGADKKDP